MSTPPEATSTRQLDSATVGALHIWNVTLLLVGNSKLKSASFYVSPKLVVTATRRGKDTRRDQHLEIVLTIGKPNYRGRAFVKACLKAGEPFPVKKVQLKWMKEKRP